MDNFNRVLIILEVSHDALTTYSSSKYKPINAQLRTNKLSNISAKVVDEIDKLLEPTTKEIIVYRAAAIPIITKALQSNKKLEGITFIDKAFVSTSKKSSVADSFTSPHVQGDKVANLYILHIKPGVKVVSMDESSLFGKGEGEILIDRGMKYTVTSTEVVKTKEKYKDYLYSPPLNRTRTVKKTYIHLDVNQ